MKKYFPCWVCKGQGSWVEPILDDGSGPIEYCNYCESEGLIEIGGKRHKEIVAEKIAMDIIKFKKPQKDLWSVQELQGIGFKALDLI